MLSITVGPLALFALVASITPGPNNLLLMRSGARFGVRRSLWHLWGVQCGFIGLVLLAHLGVGTLLVALPGAFTVLRWACFGYLLWLGLVILRDAKPRTTSDSSLPAETSKPMSWFEGTMFQLINPKAWMMAITIASAFYGGAAPSHWDLAIAILICICIGAPSMLVWMVWGAVIDRVLKQPRARQVFAICMALLVFATAFWMLR